MIERRALFGAALGAILMSDLAEAQTVAPASVRQNEPGPENAAVAQRAGSWDMTETVWDAPGAAPVTTTGLVAERRVIGSMLQEVLRPAADPASNVVARIDYLTFNRVEGRWDYVSMDMRAPVGIMSAWSFDRGGANRIELTFQPFATAGAGPGIGGQMLRMTQVITVLDPNREVKEQFFLPADGSGTKWLAHKYEYKRRI